MAFPATLQPKHSGPSRQPSAGRTAAAAKAPAGRAASATAAEAAGLRLLPPLRLALTRVPLLLLRQSKARRCK